MKVPKSCPFFSLFFWSLNCQIWMKITKKSFSHLACFKSTSPTGHGRPNSPVYTNLQELKICQSSLPPVPSGSPLYILNDWETHKDLSGRHFYYNRATGERTWKPPRSRDTSSSISSARGDSQGTAESEVKEARESFKCCSGYWRWRRRERANDCQSFLSVFTFLKSDTTHLCVTVLGIIGSLETTLNMVWRVFFWLLFVTIDLTDSCYTIFFTEENNMSSLLNRQF